MRIVLTFALNAGLNLVLSLALAGALGPESFGRFAIASMLVIVLVTAMYEWLRLSATRFVGEADRTADPGVRASLDLGYLAASLPLLAAAAAVLATGLDLGLGPVALALVAVAAIANARFEYEAALARALFLDRDYLRLIIVRNLLSFGLMVGAAYWLRSAEWVLAMLALSSAASTLAVRRSGGGPAAALARATRERLAAFARYGFPIVAANLVYQAIVLLNRSVATAMLGFGAAGQISLPTDLTIRLLISVGAALDVFLFQFAVRRRAEDGEAAGRAQIARNVSLVTAVLMLLAVGWLMSLPAFERLFVPVGYRGEFLRVSAALVPGVLAFCLVQFALSPIFQLAGRTLAILWTSLAALAVDVALLAALLAALPASAGIVGIAAAHSASLVAGLVVAAWLARRETECWPPLSELAAIAAAAGLATIAMWPARLIDAPVGALAWTIGVGVPVYVTVLLAFDVAGLRRFARHPRALAGLFAARPVSSLP